MLFVEGHALMNQALISNVIRNFFELDQCILVASVCASCVTCFKLSVCPPRQDNPFAEIMTASFWFQLRFGSRDATALPNTLED